MTEDAARWLTGKDGMRYRLRPIRPSDAASLTRAYDAMSSEAKWFRMLAAVPHLTEEMARDYCSPDPGQEVCLVVEGQGELAGEIVGGASVAGLTPGGWAEFSVSLRPEAQGLGLARQSLEAVIEVARDRGCRGVWGIIADPNSGMLALARRLGMRVRNDPDDWSLEVAELSFDGSERPA
jgi:acetyltransferase